MTPKRRPLTSIFACLLLLSLLLESISNIHLMFLKSTSEKVTVTYVYVESSLNRVLPGADQKYSGVTALFK